MYFDGILRTGVTVCMLAMLITGRWFVLGWAVVMLALFWVQRDAPVRFPPAQGRALFLISAGTQCALSVALALATQATGAMLLAIGQLLNIVVIAVNGGRMPIAFGGEPDNDCYTEVDDCTRLTWLCDHLRTTETSGARWIISPGDALECIGIWVLTAELFLVA